MSLESTHLQYPDSSILITNAEGIPNNKISS